ncbi:MAG: hypothetical protein U0736_14270 [Gemmataceae bacterium]
MLVVKVGGSLFSLPDLGDRLRAVLAAEGETDWLLVPGGGAAADAVRALDRWHRLGPARAHWLALRACTLNAWFLQALLPDSRVIADPAGCVGGCVLDPHAFAVADAARPGRGPPRWDATSDWVAARAAVVARAGGRPVRLLLLKSVTIPPGASWEAAAAAGFIDAHLPGLLRRSELSARAVNLRARPG